MDPPNSDPSILAAIRTYWRTSVERPLLGDPGTSQLAHPTSIGVAPLSPGIVDTDHGQDAPFHAETRAHEMLKKLAAKHAINVDRGHASSTSRPLRLWWRSRTSKDTTNSDHIHATTSHLLVPLVLSPQVPEVFLSWRD
ncbi:hypothetical protein FRB94_009315 [Tulasnella sp. JGI-2019a]|nr:hypothetical protein FRB94_009315 [Tulasnella sp. JGI-2019a]